MNDPQLDRVLRAVRRAPAPSPDLAGFSAPPGFARAVVTRWLAVPDEPLAESWAVISRRGLAVALGLMMASMLWHARVQRSPVLMESSASDTVLLSVYPQ